MLEGLLVAYFLGLRLPFAFTLTSGMGTPSTWRWSSPCGTTPLGRLEEGLRRVRDDVWNLREVVDGAIAAGSWPARGNRAPGQ